MSTKDDSKDKRSVLKNLYLAYSEDIYKITYYICKDQYIAEEIVQETFIKAYTKLDTLDNPDKVKSWLITIASNLTKRRLRSTKTTLTLYPDFTDYEANPALENNYSGNLSPDAFIEDKELQEYLKTLLDTLEPEFREVIILYYYNQLSYTEIAAQLNLRLGTVKSRLSRAKKKLKERYNKKQYGL